MEFNTWYQLNCDEERVWRDDFSRMRDAGFDQVVLWSFQRVKRAANVLELVDNPAKTSRALDAAERCGLKALLGCWNPSMLGPTPAAYRPRTVDGYVRDRADIFNTTWLQRTWVPYLQRLAKNFKDHPAYEGLLFDDSWSILGEGHYWGYTPANIRRYQAWLKERYLTIGNLNMKYRMQKQYRSFSEIKPPRAPEGNFAQWTDWMEARAEWNEAFARLTCETYRRADPDPRRRLSLSDYDHYVQRNAMQWGVDYTALMRHFDRFEIYLADDHHGVSRKALLKNVEYVCAKAKALSSGKPYQFLTWWTDPFKFEPVGTDVVLDMLACAASFRPAAIGLYTFEIHDWRAADVPGALHQPFKAISLKHHAKVLEAFGRGVAKLRRDVQPARILASSAKRRLSAV